MLSDMIREALHSEYEDPRICAPVPWPPGPRAASSLYTRYARARHEYISDTHATRQHARLRREVILSAHTRMV